MKIDIRDIEPELLDHPAQAGIITIPVHGTAPDGSPACATLRPTSRKLV